MAIHLSKEPLLSREDLVTVGEARLGEGILLQERGHYAAAIYSAGLSVECFLKGAVCKSLDWDHLLAGFKSHDLEGLLRYSGFDRQLRAEPDIVESFNRLAQRWAGKEDSSDREEPGSVRYKLPSVYDEGKADEFMKWVIDSETGVVPWLRSRIG